MGGVGWMELLINGLKRCLLYVLNYEVCWVYLFKFPSLHNTYLAHFSIVIIIEKAVGKKSSKNQIELFKLINYKR